MTNSENVGLQNRTSRR